MTRAPQYRLVTEADLATLLGGPALPALTGLVADMAPARVTATKHAPAFGMYFPEAEGAVGDNIHDDTAAINAAIAAAVAAGGGEVHLRPVTYKITGAGLVLIGSRVDIVGAGIQSILSYTGTGTALTLNNKTSGVAITNLSLRAFKIQGSSAGACGLALIGVQFSNFYGLRVEGFTAVGAIGVKYDTQSTGTFQASINNTWFGGYITNCTNGLKVTKDPADTGSDGSNHNSWYGLRVSAFTNIGIDNDAGENNAYYGCDSSTGTTGTIGVRINDDVCAFYQIRADNSSAGVGLAAAYGIYITANGSDHVIINPTGNGPIITQRVFYENPAITGMVMRQSFHAWMGDVRRSLVATGADRWIARAWKNVGTSTIGIGEIGYFDSTMNEGEVKRGNSALASLNPMVAVETIAAGATGGFAEPGSVCTLAVDTAAVAVGDLLVPSTTANGRAKTDNTATSPRSIIGKARSAKVAGANGTIKVYIT